MASTARSSHGLRLDEIIDALSRSGINEPILEEQRLEDLPAHPRRIDKRRIAQNHGVLPFPPPPPSPPPTPPRPPPPPPPPQTAAHLTPLSSLINPTPDAVEKAANQQRLEHERRQLPRAFPLWQRLHTYRLLSGAGLTDPRSLTEVWYSYNHPVHVSSRFASQKSRRGEIQDEAQRSEWQKTVRLLRREVRLQRKLGGLESEYHRSDDGEKREGIESKYNEYKSELSAVQKELDQGGGESVVLRYRVLGGRRVRCVEGREEGSAVED